ncbi:uncharacterized protein LOC113336917 isoform X2 [Papaver somniferum]|uniref:uncharacterized protein LOC113336917 isoform X2 n=1 Tax=Papaver somniferum TaxID=3469 RepID=UPI000E705AF7|nr:uncharacterized protein LOC113336917 isoform X2 [Papaver somniferum]
MALTNFLITVAGVGAVVLLLRGDVRQTASIFKRNVRHIRKWVEEESSAVSNSLCLAIPYLRTGQVTRQSRR